MKYSIIKYSSAYADQWNNFIHRSKNGTFLFHRDFMEYHSDRFEDFSLLVFDGQKLVAVLPANRVGDEVHSHQGLTYGGLVYDSRIKQAAVIIILKEVLQYLHGNSVATLNIKPVPFIYHTMPAQEQEYALFLVNAILVRRDSMSVIDTIEGYKIASNRMEGIKKGITNRFEVKESDNFAAFWNDLLVPNLLKRHNVKPVHSLEEIIHLKKLFPQNIRLFIAQREDHIEAGAVIFETETVAHVQYIASAENKNETGSLDFLFYQLITEVFAAKRYFDFGISNEQQGRKLNRGLAFWKESFGARTLVHDFYIINTENHKFID